MEHAALLQETRRQFDESGFIVRTESQNAFKWPYRDGIYVGGKPDMIAIKRDTPTRGLVIDCKTGQPMASHKVQVLLYIFMITNGSPEYQGVELTGKVFYRDKVEQVPANQVDQRFSELVTYWIDTIAASSRPLASPSLSSCDFCDITKIDCPDRYIAKER